jgi:transmembrane sensor
MGLQTIMELETLLTRYLEKKCSPEEKQKLYELLSSSDNERSFKELLLSHLSDFNEYQYENHSVDFDNIYTQILSELKHREINESEKRLLHNRFRIKRLIFQCITIAAVFCLAFFLGRIFNTPDNRFAPETSDAANFSEIKAPLGSRSEVKLADGTEVMLNAGSTIKYRSDFNSSNRDLILEGEAYFKVARNIDIPLVVNTGNLKIKATGTEFNVKAYSDEGIVETTLIEGKVEILQKGDKDKIMELIPNQKAIYASESNQIILKKIREKEPLAMKPAKVVTHKLLVSQKADVDEVTAWTHNKLIIRSENLESLCIKLQRKYNVIFVFTNEEIKKFRFSGVLLDETFEQIMDVIKLTAPVDYLLDGKNVLMFSNKEQTEKYSRHLNKYKN